MRLIAALLALLILSSPAFAQQAMLVRRGEATQLIVDGKPFLILGGELSNSASSSAAYMEPIWPKLRALGLNAVLTPVSWELIEPQEGRFDFSSVDALIDGARKHDLKLVLLWFGAWKNSMSSYVPSWVKRDQERFPRVQLPDGSGQEILSVFSPAVLAADEKAFAALLAHLREVDSRQGTVLMMQVENEVAMLPTARDHSALANRAYAGPVPAELTRYLAAHRASLVPSPREQWENAGSRASGSWEQVFGPGIATEEIFTAWHYARFLDALTRAGKRAYDLPMYVNAALNRPGKLPGEYPSGGPLPHLFDIWKAGAPALDFLAPDIYFPNFTELAAKYDRPDNLLFVPEANRAGNGDSGANAFWVLGEHKAIGFSPFAIDLIGDPASEPLRQAYQLLEGLTPAVLEAQAAGKIRATKPPMAYDGSVDEKPQALTLGDYEFTVGFMDPWTPREKQQPGSDAAMIIQTGPEEYLIAGQGAVVSFKPLGSGPPIAGIDSAWEETFAGGRWQKLRLLNGDETHQGRHIRLPPGEYSVQRVKLYRYR